MNEAKMSRRIKAGRGPGLRCRGWRQETLLRMLENVLEVGERPEDLVIYMSSARAARDWDCFDRIVAHLREMDEDETLLIQSGKPVGRFSTHADAPLVLMANANLVGQYSRPEVFYELEAKGLTMTAGFTAGGWQYIGSQGIVQGTYMTFQAVAGQCFGGSLAGRFVVTGGCGGMGGAQPLAVTMNGGVALVVDVNPAKIQRRVDNGYCHRLVYDLDEALAACLAALAEKRPFSVGLVGNAAEVLPELLRRGVVPDVVTDQTAASDPLAGGYVPVGYDAGQAAAFARSDPDQYLKEAFRSMAIHMESILEFQKRGAVTFEYGNLLREKARDHGGVANAFDVPGFMEKFIRPFFCRGCGPFRWIAVSGDPADLEAIDALLIEEFPDEPHISDWLELAARHLPLEGLPARICWAAHGQRSKIGVMVNDLVRTGRLRGPVAFTRDHLDAASVAMPHRETENMLDGSDAIADWPLLNALLNATCRADLVTIHSAGGGSTGVSVSSGVTLIADGSPTAEIRLRKALDAETGLGILRYADAGYDIARECARNNNIGRPSPRRP
ncbi:MAG: urocanate hydratase [Pseudomonadota bacterium]